MKFNGSDFKAKLPGGTVKTIADTRTLTIGTATASIDVSTRDSAGWKEIIGGQRSWTFSITGIVDYTEGTNEAGVKAMLALEVARALIDLQFGGDAVGYQTYTGQGLVNTVEITAEYESSVEYTIDGEGSGPLTIATVA